MQKENHTKATREKRGEKSAVELRVMTGSRETLEAKMPRKPIANVTSYLTQHD